MDLPKEIVERIIDEKYSKDQYLTIMVKLFLDFDLDEYDNYFEFASNDYSPADNSDRPYIEYTQ